MRGRTGVTAIARDEHLWQTRNGAHSGRGGSGAARRENAVIDSGARRDHCAKHGRTGQNCTSLERTGTTVEDGALAPEHRVATEELERLLHTSGREALARRGAPELRHVPADEARILGKLDAKTDRRARAVEQHRFLR